MKTWYCVLLAGFVAMAACGDDKAARESAERATNTLAAAKDAAQTAATEAARLIQADRPADAKAVLRKRLDAVTGTIDAVTTDVVFTGSDRDTVLRALRAEKENLEQMLAKY